MTRNEVEEFLIRNARRRMREIENFVVSRVRRQIELSTLGDPDLEAVEEQRKPYAGDFSDQLWTVLQHPRLREVLVDYVGALAYVAHSADPVKGRSYDHRVKGGRERTHNPTSAWASDLADQEVTALGLRTLRLRSWLGRTFDPRRERGYCPGCGSRRRPGDTVCAQCGSRLRKESEDLSDENGRKTKRCWNRSCPHRSGQRFPSSMTECPGCGEELKEAS